ncbi:uncharacterized protein SETTUDRAFT_35893 [Exserohilum turcica Et28A]|uniref:Uncharacterized protein n=1 Tax=Exserohilum turcicum (strain 28A) TaxID=671987 RepID=R0JU03_EXST2|nr:uncharacterized protein SETTUDRAFT_35893 [Exserohilum turcica Et28A]EOA81009.1 hypothetical protein SETTUDRAFT_35893 [Exserohilum turcica Et28A]
MLTVATAAITTTITTKSAANPWSFFMRYWAYLSRCLGLVRCWCWCHVGKQEKKEKKKAASETLDGMPPKQRQQQQHHHHHHHHQQQQQQQQHQLYGLRTMRRLPSPPLDALDKRHRNGGDVQLTCTRPCRTIQDRRGAGHWETAAARLASWLTFLREPGVASLAPALGDACGKGFTFCIRCRKHCAMSLHDFRLAGRMVGGVQLLGIVRRRYRSFSVCAGAGKHGQVSQGRPDDEADGQDDDGGDDMGSTTVIRVASALGESGDTAGGAAVFGV